MSLIAIKKSEEPRCSHWLACSTRLCVARCRSRSYPKTRYNAVSAVEIFLITLLLYPTRYISVQVGARISRRSWQDNVSHIITLFEESLNLHSKGARRQYSTKSEQLCQSSSGPHWNSSGGPHSFCCVFFGGAGAWCRWIHCNGAGSRFFGGRVAEFIWSGLFAWCQSAAMGGTALNAIQVAGVAGAALARVADVPGLAEKFKSRTATHKQPK
jgi:hypothetical protein